MEFTRTLGDRRTNSPIMAGTRATTDTGRADPRDLSVAVVRKNAVDLVRVSFSEEDEVRTKLRTCYS